MPTNKMPGAPKTFYITTTLPYVNAEPHVGHAMEFVRADVIARAKKLAGFDVFFNTGTDEHGLKIYTKANEAGVGAQQYVDEQVKKFRELDALLGLLPELHFIRTTDPHHVRAAQEFWKRCDGNGFIYKKNYKIKYCVGCELEKTDSELVDGRCPLHPNLEIEIIDEENYFFRFSAFTDRLLKLYTDRPDFVIPSGRQNEIRAFVERGLEDFSISRLASKMSWGIPVPGDETQVMYVWFDALVNYISTLGWPEDERTFQKYWEAGTPVQYCGKDNLRQQSAMWQAMLMAAGLPTSRRIVINGFITGEGGVKMSKSLGNTVDPVAVIREFGTDAFRYYVTRELSPFEDSPFSLPRFKEAYNANLANGLGNLVSRVMKMATANGIKARAADVKRFKEDGVPVEEARLIDSFELSKAMDAIWSQVAATDAFIQKNQPFKLIKTDRDRAVADIQALLLHLIELSIQLRPFMPETAAKIQTLVESDSMPAAPLFLRKE